MTAASVERNACNAARYRPATSAGHYESWFVRANHPARPLAFWIRYTIFSPLGSPADAVGELWAVWFDGERFETAAARQVFPIEACSFGRAGLDVRIGEARLGDSWLEGVASSRDHELRWALEMGGGQDPLRLLPERLYEGKFPKAKALVPLPNAVFSGAFAIDGEAESIDGWQGSQNHNWGSAHTDSYAWGQVAGFDEDPDSFLECSTAQLKAGPMWTPPISLVVLRAGGEEFEFNSLVGGLRARGRFELFDWRIQTARRGGARVKLRVHAPRAAFVGLTYANPPGWTKTCLNTKIAACEVVLERRGRPPLELTTSSAAAFEILTDRDDHGVPVVV